MEKRMFSNKDIYNLIIPLIIELALQLVVGLLDSFMISSVSEEAVSGVSLVDSIVQLLIYVFSALATGGTIICGQYLGAKQIQQAKKSANHLMVLNGCIGVVAMVGMFVCKDWILTNVFGEIDANVYYHAEKYLFVIIFSIPAIALYEASTTLFRTMKNSKITMQLSLLMNIMNCIGNTLFIYYYDMGAQGAALSTVIARYTATILILYFLKNPNIELSIHDIWKEKYHISMFHNILAMGIPNGIENGIFQLGK